MRAMYQKGGGTCFKVELIIELNTTGEPVNDRTGVAGGRRSSIGESSRR